MKKLLFLGGSLREKSYNKMLAKTAAEMAKSHPDVEATYVDLLDYEMPIYNGDIEDKSGLPKSAQILKKKFVDNQGVFIATPEYNSSISAVLKNTLDWLSRPHVENEPPLIAFKGKVGLITAASPGALGGIRALVPLRLMLSNIGMNVLGDQLAIPHAHKVFDGSGIMIDEKKKETLNSLVEQFVNVVSA